MHFCSFPDGTRPGDQRRLNRLEVRTNITVSFNPTQHYRSPATSYPTAILHPPQHHLLLLLLLPSKIHLKSKCNYSISSALNLGKKGQLWAKSCKMWDPVGQRVGGRKLYSNKKSDVIIYHPKSYLFMKQKQNEILGWILPELFNLKWLIPYKAQEDPSSVLMNTLSLFLNRKTGGGGRRGRKKEETSTRCFLLCFVLKCVVWNVFQRSICELLMKMYLQRIQRLGPAMPGLFLFSFKWRFLLLVIWNIHRSG